METANDDHFDEGDPLEEEESLINPDYEVEEGEDSEAAETSEGEEYEEEQESESVNQNISQIEHSEVYVAGENLTVIKFVQKGISLSSLHSSQVKKTLSVFVTPSVYPQAKKLLQDKRLLILQGEPHTGKVLFALNLALDVELKERCKTYSVRFSEDTAFADFLDDRERPRNGIFIIHDAFVVPGMSTIEIQRHYAQLRLLLESCNSYAILTTDTDKVRLAEMPDDHLIILDRLGKLDLGKVLDKHLDYYGVSLEKKEFIKQKNVQIVEELGTAWNIDRFVQKLLNVDELNEPVLRQLIESVTNTRKEYRQWFESLKPNERYYIMLVSLCPELDKDNLWNLYEHAVATLQSRKVKLDSPLEYSEEDLWLKTGLHEAGIGSLEFINPVYTEYTLEQVRNAYRHQFRVLLPIFTKWIVEHNRNDSASERDARIAIASAVGELAKKDWKKIVPHLNDWAMHETSTVRTAVAHALRQAAGDLLIRENVQSLLNLWKESPHSRLRWTAAAACERLYPYLPDETIEILFSLAKDQTLFVQKAVVHALVGIAQRDIDAVIDWIYQGLIDDNQMRQITAAKTFRRIRSENRYLRRLIQDMNGLSRLLPVMEELCKHRWESMKTAMEIFKQWLLEGIPELAEMIADILLKVCREGSMQTREEIISYLQEWMNPEEPAVYRTSAMLLTMIQHLPPPAVLEFGAVRDTSNSPELRHSSRTFIIHGVSKTFHIHNENNDM